MAKSIKSKVSRFRKNMKKSVWLSRGLISLAILSTLLIVAIGLFNSSFFTVQTVFVSGAVNVEDQAVLSAADIAEEEKIFSLDLASAEERVEELPWVREASISRSLLGGEVVVTVTERSAVAGVPVAAGFMLVDGEGVQLETAETLPERLPQIKGFEFEENPGSSVLSEVKDILRVHTFLGDVLGDRVDFYQSEDGQVEAYLLEGGGKIKLGQPDLLVEKKESLREALKSLELACLEYLDLQIPPTHAIKRVEGCEVPKR